jgi:hypothetical protein
VFGGQRPGGAACRWEGGEEDEEGLEGAGHWVRMDVLRSTVRRLSCTSRLSPKLSS